MLHFLKEQIFLAVQNVRIAMPNEPKRPQTTWTIVCFHLEISISVVINAN